MSKDNVRSIHSGKAIFPTKDAMHNFCPSVWCPHCKKHQKCAVSGYGGRVSERWKVCKFCDREFTIRIIVTGMKEPKGKK